MIELFLIANPCDCSIAGETTKLEKIVVTQELRGVSSVNADENIFSIIRRERVVFLTIVVVVVVQIGCLAKVATLALMLHLCDACHSIQESSNWISLY